MLYDQATCETQSPFQPNFHDSEFSPNRGPEGGKPENPFFREFNSRILVVKIAV